MKDNNHKPFCPEEAVASGIFIDKILKRYGHDFEEPEMLLRVNWEKIIGADVASLCSLAKLENGILFLKSNHPSHASLVRMRSGEIIKSIKGVFPELNIVKIYVQINKYGRTT